MSQLPRLFGVALCVSSFTVVARAQVAPPAEPPPPAAAQVVPGPATEPAAVAAVPADQSLDDNVHNVFHWILMGRYDMANGQIQQALGRDPAALLAGFESEIKKQRMERPDFDRFLLQSQNIPALKNSIVALKTRLAEAEGLRFRDPAWIRQNIVGLAGNPLHQMLSLERLQRSGELAVPMMVDMLRDPAQMQFHAGIRDGLRSMGRVVINPLAAATEMRGDPTTLIAVSDILSNFAAADVAPYLLRIVQDNTVPPIVKDAVRAHLTRLGINPQTARAGDLFYNLAEQTYYGNTMPGMANQPTAFVWSWDNDRKVLIHKDVPTAVWNSVMTMRTAEWAWRQGTARDAIGLWLSANNRRETELKEGESSVLFMEYPAHLTNVLAGTERLNSVLARALRDRKTAVVLKAELSLQQIAGRATFPSRGGDSPLLDALKYPDRRVTYEAAIAIASALPNQPFAGQERVVQLLAEAVAQNGTGGILILAPNDPARLALAAEFKGFTVASATTADKAINESATLPSVDAIVISEQTDEKQINDLLAKAKQTPRMERSARLILARPGSTWSLKAMDDPMFTVTKAVSGEPLLKALEEARSKAAGGTMDEKGAGDFAVKAANHLSRIATGRGATVLDATLAERTLLAALNDARPDVVKAVAGVLGQIDSTIAQSALADKAGADKVADDQRAAMYKAVASSAKLYGNRLDAGRVDKLQKTVSGDGPQDLRTAAAEAAGALNLPATQLQNMLLNRPPANAPAAPAGPPATAPAAPDVPAATPVVPAAPETPAAPGK